MNTTQAKNNLRIYKENEDANRHAENYVLLANLFGTLEDQMIAKANLWYQVEAGHVSPFLSSETHNRVNRYYYELEAATGEWISQIKNEND